uniref:tetratricopeptide repeat protein n=1 Tax=Novosphingobium sp. B 225 TaxID=1961849 RepID=UPI001595122A
MTSNRIRSKILPLGLAGAIAALAIAGAGISQTATAKPSPDKTAQAAQTALAKGQVDKAIQLAEGLVAAAPREPAYRALLGHAYLKSGRFESAVTTFNDAMKLGDNTSRTALGLALSNVAAGKPRDAVAILDDWRDAIPAADLGLALALAGESSRGVAILSDALRSGDASAKVRQNLAYAYALDGRWRDARVMAAMDVPADQIDARLSAWAEKSKPEDARLRVAGLLNAPIRADGGQPTALALSDNPPAEQLAAEQSGAALAANLVAQAPAAAAELPAAQPASPEAAAALANYAPVGAPPAPVEVAAPVQAPIPAQQSFAASFAPT